jgi:hypothetical protein
MPRTPVYRPDGFSGGISSRSFCLAEDRVFVPPGHPARAENRIILLERRAIPAGGWTATVAKGGHHFAGDNACSGARPAGIGIARGDHLQTAAAGG